MILVQDERYCQLGGNWRRCCFSRKVRRTRFPSPLVAEGMEYVARLSVSLDTGSSLDAREPPETPQRDPRRLADLVEEFQAVLAQFLILDIDRDLVEEGIDRGPELRHGGHCCGEILARHGSRRALLGGFDGRSERPFFGLTVELRIRRPDVLPPVPLLLDANDVGGALVAGEQIPAVVRIQEAPQSVHPADDQHEIVLAAQCEHGINQIVARALLAKLNLQAIREEYEQVIRYD